MSTPVATALATALGALFRVRCAGCRAWGGDGLCAACQAAWPAPPDGAPPAGVDAVIAGAAHMGPARGAVVALKFGGRPGLARPLAAAIAVRPDLPGPPWLLVPVPLTPGRRWRRGYNQAAVLARALARHHGHRVADVLRRRGAGQPQSRLGRAARLVNARGGTVACRRRLDGARIILVDDVLTTGATAAACAAALRAAGAEAVVLAVATRTPEPAARLGPGRYLGPTTSVRTPSGGA